MGLDDRFNAPNGSSFAFWFWTILVVIFVITMIV